MREGKSSSKGWKVGAEERENPPRDFDFFLEINWNSLYSFEHRNDTISLTAQRARRSVWTETRL